MQQETVQAQVAVGYVRVSTSKQANEGLSLDEQEHRARVRADADGYMYGDTYRDAGLSGKNVERPDLQRLITDAEQGLFQRVYVFKLDRLSRRAKDLLDVTDQLERAGVSLVSLSEGIDTTTPTGRFLRTTLSAVAEVELENIRERNRLGAEGRRRAGRRNGGPRPLGYTQSEGVLTIVEVEAVVVRRMFSEVLAGRSQSAVARDINRDGVRTVRGALWSQTRVAQTISNPLYTGKLRTAANGVVAGNHEPIVDDETWERMQALLASRGPSKGRGRPVSAGHLFTHGLLRCSCGEAMAPRSEARIPPVYRCSGRHQGRNDCKQRPLPRDVIDTAALDYFMAAGLDMEATHARIAEAVGAKVAELDALLAHASLEAQRARERLARVKRDYTDGALTVDEWRCFEVELVPQLDAAVAAEEQLRAQRDRSAEDAVLRDVEAEVLMRLAEIRAAVEGCSDEVENVGALRAALRTLFAAFVLTSDPPEYATDAGLTVEGGYWLEPVVKEHVTAGYRSAAGEPWRPVLTPQVPLVAAETNHASRP
jgi:site-specific DNA recombinase